MINSTNGNINLSIPSSFHGPIIVAHKHGSVKFSDEIDRHLTSFGEAGGIRHSFVGDFSTWGEDGEWPCDEIQVDARHGGVRIQYDDDVVGSVLKVRPSMLGSIFGF